MSKISERRRKARIRRHRRIRRRVFGTAARPRLAVFRSSRHIYAQLIDDVAGHTIAAASTRDAQIVADAVGKSGREQAALVGRIAAERAKEAGIETVVFDRGGFGYHGRVRALAEAARESGLSF
jgi:large subunit ribosomal protein L18